MITMPTSTNNYRSSGQNCISIGITYQNLEGELATGRQLRALIAAKTGLDARKMRLVLKGAQRYDAGQKVTNSTGIEDEEDHGVPLSNGAVLANWELEAPNVAVEVQEKRRGGKKPGNGWHTQRPNGRTYQMSIAGAIVREVVFSKVEQYFTVIENGSLLDSMAQLCKKLDKNAVVVCGG